MTLRFLDTLGRWRTLLGRLPVRRAMINLSPPRNEGLKDLSDKSLFKLSFPVLAVRVPTRKIATVLRAGIMKESLLDFPRMHNVMPDSADPNGDRLVLLKLLDQAELPADVRDFLKPISTGLVTYHLDFDYEYWTTEEILRSVLPDHLRENAPSGFSIVGHIGHLNLNSEYLPYKYLLGQVILDKNKALKTVVNKLDTIHSKFRYFDMELLAGEPNFLVQHNGCDCRFTFDFSKVYFNPRLQREHERLVALFHPPEVIADVFAGVGPFAIPAARKGCAVWANDLNPASYEYLKKNIQDNWVSKYVDARCLDGRDFIRTVPRLSVNDPFRTFRGPPLSRTKEKKIRKNLESPSASERPSEPATGAGFRMRIDHFVLNLPELAISFLDAFRGIFREDKHTAEMSGKQRELASVYDRMPMVHCYCFTRELVNERAKEDIQKRVEEVLKWKLEDEVQFHMVRNVAPGKDMWCISFRLPREVGFARED